MRKRSPNIKIARTVMKIGAVKLKAVIFASGVIDNAVKNISMAAILITLLMHAALVDLYEVDQKSSKRNKSGKRKSQAKKIRKKATWNGCRTSETKRTIRA